MNSLRFIFLYIFLIISCTSKKDEYVVIEGTSVVKLKLSNLDSLVNMNSSIKLYIQKPDSFTCANGDVIKNIDYVIFDCGALAYRLNPNITGFEEMSKNFNRGNLEGYKSRTLLSLKKGVNYYEDTYTCRESGIFWFRFVTQSIDYKIVTTDGKKYKAMVSLDFDVPDRHTQMLLNYCPQLTEGVNYMSSEGFGHYVFRVVP